MVPDVDDNVRGFLKDILGESLKVLSRDIGFDLCVWNDEMLTHIR